MDTKNDDSAGSDSLDKTLQKKCVVDDMGQGEGVAEESSCSNSEQKFPALQQQAEQQSENSSKTQKTERNVGDGGGGVAGGGVDILNTKKAQQLQSEETQITLTDSNTAAEDILKSVHTAITAASTSSNSTDAPSNKAFETRVKQISKDLKETTLAESAKKKTTLEDSFSSSSTSSSATEYEQAAAASCSSHCLDTNQAPELETSALSDGASANDSIDEQDQRSKKVRFHPDVKENDGGNRVIPKKKKKYKTADEATESGQRTGTEDDMEMDDDEDAEEQEEEFDLAKTIAEAQDYLKIHPLSFVRPQDKTAEPLQDGLLEEKDLPQVSVSSEEEEDEDFYEEVSTESGVQRILGKQIKCGKIEFLLRYADRPGLFWETEEFITQNCPNLLNKYEENREHRQERLMRHVAKRQIMRQRYTDF